MSFADFKKARANTSKLKDKENETGSKNKDPRIWKSSYDKDTYLGTALIRFLPRMVDGEISLPWVAWTEFNFSTNNGYYANRNLASINEEDPVGKLNKAHWAKIPKDNRDNNSQAAEARKRKVNKKWLSNIVVINDPANPENNGKNFLFKFGPQLHSILENAWFPEYEDQASLEFFNLDEGADFRIRTKKSKFGLTYEDSKFEEKKPLAKGNIDTQEKIYNKMYDLAEFESKDNYKSYDELHKQMCSVLGGKYIAKIMGEEYTQEKAIEADENPFDTFDTDTTSHEQQDTIEQYNDSTNVTEEDPFANVSSDDEEDPFANVNL